MRVGARIVPFVSTTAPCGGLEPASVAAISVLPGTFAGILSAGMMASCSAVSCWPPSTAGMDASGSFGGANRNLPPSGTRMKSMPWRAFGPNWRRAARTQFERSVYG
jgi:hypothetical protein